MLIGLDVIFCKRISICFLTLFFPNLDNFKSWCTHHLWLSCNLLLLSVAQPAHTTKSSLSSGEIGLNNVLSVLGQPFRM
jgi:hypothetical protein